MWLLPSKQTLKGAPDSDTRTQPMVDSFQVLGSFLLFKYVQIWLAKLKLILDSEFWLSARQWLQKAVQI